MLPNKIRDRRSNNTKKPIRSKMKRRKDHREEVWYSLPLPVFDHIGEDINSREQENASFVEWENQEKKLLSKADLLRGLITCTRQRRCLKSRLT